MAAFIQRLFRSRKTPEATAPGKNSPASMADEQEPSRSDQREEQLRILDGSPSQADLAELAINGATADIRQRAASRLSDPDTLQDVLKRAKGRDKGVYQTVKLALQAHREEQARLNNIHQNIAALISHASEQARSEDTKLYKARLDALINQWSDVETHATPEQTQAFLEAVHRCRGRLAAMQSAAEDEQRQRDQATQRSETLALLADTLEELQRHAPDTLPSLASLDALQKTQENRWLEATRDTAVDKQEQKSYETSMLTLRNYVNAVRRASQAREEINDITAKLANQENATDDQRSRASVLLKEISWPEGYPEPVPLASLRQLAGKRASANTTADNPERQRALAERLERTIAQLEAALEAKQLKESKQLFKAAQQQVRELDGRRSKPFQPRMQLLNGQLRELSDWQGFATEPKQIALCEQMEYLAEQPMDPEAKAERIKELQNEWRELGGSSDRTLWSRFKAASDRAFEPCKAYFSAKSGLKQANLEKRTAICDQLEAFLDNADWSSVDWKAAERIHQTARQEWKEAWPVEFRDNRQVQKRFDELLKRLEAPLDQERLNNEQLKQDIVQRAEALVQHEPLQDAMNQAKALQSEWKAIGITRHREDRKLWQAFRKACDQIFARRDAERSEQQEAARAADEAAQASLQEAAELAAANDEASAGKALSILRAIDTSTVSRSVREQVQQEQQRVKALLSTLRLQNQVVSWQELITTAANGKPVNEQIPDHWPSLARGIGVESPVELVIRAEILCGVPSPESDQQRRMEIQVQRLADGMGASGIEADPLQEVEALVASWCLGQPGSAGSDQAARLNAALASLKPT